MIKTWQEHHDQHDCFAPAVYMQIEIDELRAENAKLSEVLKAMHDSSPSNLECCVFHHAKADRHHFTDVCKPSIRFKVALEAARAALREKS